MFTALTDIGQPYSCNQWGNIGQDGLPMIVNDGNGWGNHFFNWFNSSSAMPSNVFIDHTMTVYYQSNHVSYSTANNQIQQMLNNCGDLCNGIQEVEGCMDENAINFDPDATIENNSCDYGIMLEFGNYNGYEININLSNPISIGGFQFSLNTQADDFILIEANNGLANDYGFTVTSSETGVVLGFSLEGLSIPSGEGILTTLNFSGGFNSSLCIQNTILASFTLGEVNVSTGDCIILDYPQQIGDFNMDGYLDILDVVLLVNLILEGSVPTTYQSIACDINLDNAINIIDVVQMVNIILE